MTARLNGQALPDSWVWTTVGCISDTTKKRVKPQDYPDFRFIGLDNIEPHTMRLLSTVSAGDMKSSAEQFRADDVLYCRLRPYLNKVFKPDFDGLCSGEFIVFRNQRYIDSRYLQYFLNSWKFVSFASHQTEGDRPRISFDQMEGYSFPLAPLNEQHRIVDAIETQFTRLDAAVTAYRAAVLKAACEGRLVPTEAELAQTEGHSYEPATVLLERILAERRQQWEAENPKKRYKEPVAPDTSDLPELPAGWVWTKVKYVGRVQLGRQRAPQHHTGPHMRPYLQVANVYEDRIDVSDVLEMNFEPTAFEKYRLKYGDILLNEGQSPEYLGRPAMFRDEVQDACFQNTLIRFQAYDCLDRRYALIQFRNYMHTQRFMGESQITTNIAHLSVGRFSEIEFPLPPLAEQQRIVAEVERRLSLIDQLEKTVAADLARANRLRQSILKRAFAGKLVPQDPNDEPASVLLERIQAAKNSEPVQPSLPIPA